MASSSFRPGCIAQCIFYFSAFLLFQVTIGARNRGEPINWGLFLVVVIVAIGLSKIGLALTKTDRADGTKDRDEAAQSLITTLQHNESSGRLPSFSLYLRPFSITGRLSVNNPQGPPGILSPDMFSYEGLLDIEEVFAQSLEPIAPLHALGHPGEAVGAGRIPSTEEGWRADFELLAKKAGAILVIPSSHSGTKWEIEWLKANGALDRVIFVMPPSVVAERSASGAVSLASEWELASSALSEVGIALPPYRQEGLMFTLDDGGRPHGESPFLFTSHRGVRNAFKKLFNQRKAFVATEKNSTVSWSKPAKVSWWKRRKLPTVSYFLITIVFAGTAFLCQRADKDDTAQSPSVPGLPQNGQSLGDGLSGMPMEASGLTKINSEGDTFFIPRGWSASRTNERTVVVKAENLGAICQAVGYVDNQNWPADLFFLAAPSLEHDLISGSEGQASRKDVQVSLIEQEERNGVLGYRATAEIFQDAVVHRRAFIRVLRSGGHALRIDCIGELPNVIFHSPDISVILSSAHLANAAHQATPAGQLEDNKLDLYLGLASSFLEENETQKTIMAARGAIAYIKNNSRKNADGALKISLQVASKLALPTSWNPRDLKPKDGSMRRHEL